MIAQRLKGNRPDFEQAAAPGQWQRRLVRLGLLLILPYGLSGCLSLPQHTTETAPPEAVQTSDLGVAEPSQPSATPQSEPEQEPTGLWWHVRRDLALQSIQHPRIDTEIKRLQRSPDHFDVMIGRAKPYLYYIVKAVERRGLPAELALLPAVESGFRPRAHSPLGAAGLWQFMPATGRALGLQQDWWYDGRRDVLAATDAALDYLEQLNRRFDGNWLYTLAAYNAGGGTVSQAIRKARKHGRSTAFWDLDLPAETESYVPRVLAFAAVIRDPGQYGLALPEIEDAPYFTRVACGGQIDLKVAADLAGLTVEELLVLNPGYKRWATRPKGPHQLLVPVEKAPSFRTALASLPENKRLRWKHYRIANGDNLGSIARRYKVSVKAIMVANGLKSTRIRAGRSLRIPLSESVAMAVASERLGMPRSRLRYRVRHGDSLYKIARKFQVKIADLRRWNRVGRYLHPGQHLTVFVNDDSLTL